MSPINGSNAPRKASSMDCWRGRDKVGELASGGDGATRIATVEGVSSGEGMGVCAEGTETGTTVAS
ncbi:MAG: hypothetical protein AAFS10_01920 [Myxococcota bacterium]